MVLYMRNKVILVFIHVIIIYFANQNHMFMQIMQKEARQLSQKGVLCLFTAPKINIENYRKK